MGQVFHGSATTPEAVRRAIQHSQAGLNASGSTRSPKCRDFSIFRRVEVKRLPSCPPPSVQCSSRGPASLRDRLSSRPSMGSGE
ncbi:hypothetical protein GR328_20125 [Microvirga makkahensis]|uniref:Uncharacterized protein n=1 Tax=Microvirga makkahensis TaxID=1128670 RepID=A0A7X3MVB2_9HYPH|nr:hypothetical protein [Microvirga makkahensis]